MANQQINNIIRRKPRIRKARDDLVYRVGGFGHQSVRGGDGEVEPPGEELEARGAGTIGYADGAGELDKVAEADFVGDGDGALEFYDLVCKSSLRSGVANVREPTDRRHYWQLMLSAKAGEVWCFYSPYLVSMSEWCMIEPSGGACHP